VTNDPLVQMTHDYLYEALKHLAKSSAYPLTTDQVLAAVDRLRQTIETSRQVADEQRTSGVPEV
jgi:hypothetical protein